MHESLPTPILVNHMTSCLTAYFTVYTNLDDSCCYLDRSTLQPDVDKTTYGGFVDVDIEDGKLSLRSLVSL